MSLLRDEQGSWSSARCSFWLSLLVALGCVVADTIFAAVAVPNAAYSLLGTIVVATASWAAGPRIAQYLAPQLGAIAKGIGDSRLPDIKKDDER